MRRAAGRTAAGTCRPVLSGGRDGTRELLDDQRTVYALRQGMLGLRHAELASATFLYRALGGAS
ncbi:hypothetical protein [Sphingobium sp. ba1]|uniref:hypothetical protein n=1 Tax=Sphingobium sp. ba1 TaxID=1522072 RepID=UPI000A732395|nr:hypothetical protein [Sphingobium sp. ba1]